MSNRTKWVSAFKRRLWGSWLDPLGISHRTLACAMDRACEYARGGLLDIGCGNKPYFEKFAPRVSQYVGIEMPSTWSKSTVVDVYGSGLMLPFADSSFDTVLCNQVLEHVPEPGQLLIEARRVLKSQGCLILTAPLTWGPHEEPNDFFRYTEFGLRYLAERSGFAVEKIEQTSGHWETIGQRASAFMYYHHGWRRNRVVEGIVFVLCGMVQLFFCTMDRAYGHVGDSLDYLMIACGI